MSLKSLSIVLTPPLRESMQNSFEKCPLKRDRFTPDRILSLGIDKQGLMARSQMSQIGFYESKYIDSCEGPGRETESKVTSSCGSASAWRKCDVLTVDLLPSIENPVLRIPKILSGMSPSPFREYPKWFIPLNRGVNAIERLSPKTPRIFAYAAWQVNNCMESCRNRFTCALSSKSTRSSKMLRRKVVSFRIRLV